MMKSFGSVETFYLDLVLQLNFAFTNTIFFSTFNKDNVDITAFIVFTDDIEVCTSDIEFFIETSFEKYTNTNEQPMKPYNLTVSLLHEK